MYYRGNALLDHISLEKMSAFSKKRLAELQSLWSPLIYSIIWWVWMVVATPHWVLRGRWWALGAGVVWQSELGGFGCGVALNLYCAVGPRGWGVGAGVGVLCALGLLFLGINVVWGSMPLLDVLRLGDASLNGRLTPHECLGWVGDWGASNRNQTAS